VLKAVNPRTRCCICKRPFLSKTTQTPGSIHLQQQEWVGFVENATQQLRSIGHRLMGGAAVQLL
jgi:hypothetical protein